MYKQHKNPRTNELVNGVLRLSNNDFIPFDEANTDYQEYLKWLEQGNTPLPADNQDNNQ